MIGFYCAESRSTFCLGIIFVVGSQVRYSSQIDSGRYRCLVFRQLQNGIE